MKNTFYFLLFTFLLISCSSKNEEKLGLDNTDIQNIIELQDTKDVKGLIQYFVNPNKQLRERACMAFASVKDTNALPSLYTMLEENENVAQAAAFAIGQIASPSSIKALKKVLERSMNEETRFRIFVAIGKCGGIEENYFLASNYNVGKDARGTAWALFQLSYAQKINEAGLELAIKILENEDDPRIRLGAASAISKSKVTQPWKKVLPLYKKEKDDNVQMALASGLKGIEIDSISIDLLDYAKSTSVNSQINFIASIIQIKNEILYNYTSDIILGVSNINLKIRAAEYIANHHADCAVFLNSTHVDSLNWRVRTILLAPLVTLQNDAYINYARSRYESTENLYEKGELLTILASLPTSSDWLEKEILKSDSIVSTFGISVYATILESDSIEQRIQSIPFLVECITSDNPAIVTMSAILLKDSIYLENVTISKLKEALSMLEMPKMIEASEYLSQTISFYEGVEEQTDTPTFNHPIIRDSLAYLSTINGFHINTTKGKIFMKTQAYESPGTVMSIARLVNSGYYNGKLFHRVVPNFVVQGGCPYGTGWGGLDFTMRSEFTRLKYKTGAVGIASSGQDTECCQWFITHSPTPRLEGNYSLFAYVTTGMEVVQNMEVGDRIISMTVEYNSK